MSGDPLERLAEALDEVAPSAEAGRRWVQAAETGLAAGRRRRRRRAAAGVLVPLALVGLVLALLLPAVLGPRPGDGERVGGVALGVFAQAPLGVDQVPPAVADLVAGCQGDVASVRLARRLGSGRAFYVARGPGDEVIFASDSAGFAQRGCDPASVLATEGALVMSGRDGPRALWYGAGLVPDGAEVTLPDGTRVEVVNNVFALEGEEVATVRIRTAPTAHVVRLS